MLKKNEKAGESIYDLREHYDIEAEYRGMIKSAKYILNNC